MEIGVGVMAVERVTHVKPTYLPTSGEAIAEVWSPVATGGFGTEL